MESLITIERREPRGSRARVVLIDGDEMLTTSADVLARIGLRSGAVTNPEITARQIRDAEPECAEQRALLLLNYRERTRAELSDRLLAEGYAEESISLALDRLCALDFLSDDRYAGSYVRAKARMGWGTRRIRLGLRKAGVGEALIEATLAREYPGTDEERASDLALTLAPITDADVRRAIARLVRKGYAESTARRAAFAAREIALTDHDEPASS